MKKETTTATVQINHPVLQSLSLIKAQGLVVAIRTAAVVPVMLLAARVLPIHLQKMQAVVVRLNYSPSRGTLLLLLLHVYATRLYQYWGLTRN